MLSMLRRPSTAVVTVTAGVSTPSASRAAPPSIAGTISHFPQDLTSAYSEKMPPSPWLSAFMAISTYFTVVSSVIVQITSESEPMMNCSSTPEIPPLPSMIDFITYSGEVPMSPYTMPMVTRNMAKRNLFFLSCCFPRVVLISVTPFSLPRGSSGIRCPRGSECTAHRQGNPSVFSAALP